MSTAWDFFIAHWLGVFWAIIGVAFLVIGVITAIDKIRNKLESSTKNMSLGGVRENSAQRHGARQEP